MSDSAGRGYQYGFSGQFPVMLDFTVRKRKARKIVQILEEHLHKSLSSLRGLEIGSSGGGMSVVFAESFGRFFAGDIDLPAVELARRVNRATRLEYAAIDAMTLPFPDRLFDVVICNHIYEHMPDAGQLLVEVERVLAPGGICYFGCGNRFVLFEGEYGLPLLSILPRRIATIYLRVLRRGAEYYEKTFFYWELRKLVSAFDLTDYTWKVILNPSRYEAETQLPRWGKLLRRVPFRLLRLLTPFLPSYLWVLAKKREPM